MSTPVDIPPRALRGAARLLHKRLQNDGNFGPWNQHSDEDKQAWEQDVYAVVLYLLTHGGGIAPRVDIARAALDTEQT